MEHKHTADIVYIGEPKDVQNISAPDQQIRVISYKAFDPEEDYCCTVFVVQQSDHAKDIINAIRSSKRPRMYLLPLYLDGYSHSDRDPGLAHLVDGFLEGEDVARFVRMHESFLAKVHYEIRELLNSAGDDAVRDSDPALRVIRFLYTRRRDLEPVRDPHSLFGYKYPLVDLQFNEDTYQKFTLLDYLESRHLLSGVFHDRIHLCPECYSGFLNFREVCTKCGSANLDTESLLHHFSCGHVAPQSAFERQGRFICPKCQKEPRHIGVDMDRPGFVHTCQECHHVFQEPDVDTVCYRCARQTDPEELSHQDIKIYRLTPMGSNSALFGVLLSLKEALRKELESVDLDTFKVISDMEKSRIQRYKKSTSSVGVLNMENIAQAFGLLGSSAVSELISEISAEIQKTIRTSDTVSFLNDSTLILLFTETPHDGTKVVMERLKDRIQKLVSGSVKFDLEVNLEILPVDAEFSLEQMMEHWAHAES